MDNHAAYRHTPAGTGIAADADPGATGTGANTVWDENCALECKCQQTYSVVEQAVQGGPRPTRCGLHHVCSRFRVFAKQAVPNIVLRNT